MATIPPKQLQQLLDLTQKASEAILGIFNEKTQDLQTEIKADQSPVTKADKLAHATIAEGLTKIFPHIPILSEEGEIAAYEKRKTWDLFWLVDPLDGTKEFIKKGKDFTVNIALIADGEPQFGVVSAPAHSETYFAVKGEGAYKLMPGDKLKELDLSARETSGPPHALLSHIHAGDERKAILKVHPDARFSHASSSIKFCWLAEGRYDFYLRYHPTSEWDTAAGQCILDEAGGKVYISNQGEELRYNRSSLDNPPFIALADLSIEWRRLI